VRASQAAAYEPLQLRPMALQARFNLLQARNQYLASWKQLAATLGLPCMPPAEVAGRVDMPVPCFDYHQVLDRVLARHTDVITALNTIEKARFTLKLAKVTPVPDVDVHLLVQKDTTTYPGPFEIAHSITATIALPVWDQNKGAIWQAEAQLIQANQGPDLARNTLTISLADAFNRYLTNRQQVLITMQQIRDQIRAYRAVYARREIAPIGDVTFGDVVTAQQTLVTYISAYITALGLQWTAVVDVANLLQTDDLFGIGPKEEVEPVPDLEHLLPIPFPRPGRAAGSCVVVSDPVPPQPLLDAPPSTPAP